jgi:enamine deaminase RidA (YjgF/YER057c/UK114 family)
VERRDGRGPVERRGRHIEPVQMADYDPALAMPYAPAIKVRAGELVFVAGVTAAPVYHDHPHRPEVFDSVPRDAERQARLTFAHLDSALGAAGCAREDLVVLNRYLTDLDGDQDVVNQVQADYLRGHLPTSTTVEVRRLATDPRLRLEIQAVAVAPAKPRGRHAV